MEDIKQKRLSILAEIDRLNLKRCNRCNTPNYRITKCCEANVEIRELGKELLKLRSNKAIEIEEMSREGLFEKWSQVAIKNGITINTFRSRLYSYGYGFEEAATRPVQTAQELSPEKLELIAQAEKNGINKHTFLRRLDAGWSLSDALNVPSNRSKRVKSTN